MTTEDGRRLATGVSIRNDAPELENVGLASRAETNPNSPFYRSKLGLALFFTPIMLAFVIASLAPIKGLDGASAGMGLAILIAGYIVGIGPFWLIGMALAVWADMSEEAHPRVRSPSPGLCGACKDTPAPLFWGSFLSLAGLVLFVIIHNML